MKKSHRNLSKQILNLFYVGLFLSLGCGLPFGKPKPAIGADRIAFFIPPLTDIYVSIDALEVFAKEGKITGDFALYSRFLSESDRQRLRVALQIHAPIPADFVRRMVTMPLGEALMIRLGQVIQAEENSNGYEAIKTAVIAASEDPKGLSIIGIMRKFPAANIRVNTDLLIEVAEEFPKFLKYRETAAIAIGEEAEREATTEPAIDFSQLPDLQKIGPYSYTKTELNFAIDRFRQTETGLSGSYPLAVDFYFPENLGEPAPLIVISHGFGSYRGNNNLAEHLASYGFVVAVPEHIGSNLSYREAFLKGSVSLLLSPIEYVSRPEDISYLLDELQQLIETAPEWKQRLDLTRVGVTGNSFGGTTSLSLAGAQINLPRLRQVCAPENFSLNVSLLLQCRGLYLPPSDYNLRDDRIDAAIAAHPLTSALFGPEGLSNIEVPILMVAGANDIVTPVIEEQVHPFIWMNAPKKYLSYLVPGTHFSTSIQEGTKGISGIPKFILGDNFDLGRPYFFGLNVAFFKAYLSEDDSYLPYLSAAYGLRMSQQKLNVYQIESLTPEALETAYGSSPPMAIIPETTVVAEPERDKTVLEEIKRTGVLKVGIRRDAVPFGFINNKQQWVGYCVDWAASFADWLERELQSSVPIEVIQFPSNVDNRYQSVRNQTVHLECGPNTIRENLSGVVFSNPFFISGTHFLVQQDKASEIDPDGTLAGVEVGVVKNTTSEQFLNTEYPEADEVYFRGQTGIQDAIAALSQNRVDTVAENGILALGEVARQGLNLDNYTLVPLEPLTCDFYGIILPAGDREWQNTVNRFIDSQPGDRIWGKWFDRAYSYVLLNLDYCVNR
ncbi:alpha/beta hydrolase [Lyngbya sp. CCY1209]|uniref:alpha/beta hydrolase n=1 Tax=Lyngbya sp. CCY1209 TaxID=2886103 RepID=UPI002D20FC23|nr:alpha/beta hydrolase [Lyngbya sp. CCY1209]MEB3886887.1 alpha/beta hydrolase [Lyngbya sp. CCY1209]